MDAIEQSLRTLGLSFDATLEEINQEYRALAMVWHPDRFPSNSPFRLRAEDKLKKINEAYQILQHCDLNQVRGSTNRARAQNAHPEHDRATTRTNTSGTVPPNESQDSVVVAPERSSIVLPILAAIGLILIANYISYFLSNGPPTSSRRYHDNVQIECYAKADSNSEEPLAGDVRSRMPTERPDSNTRSVPDSANSITSKYRFTNAPVQDLAAERESEGQTIPTNVIHAPNTVASSGTKNELERRHSAEALKHTVRAVQRTNSNQHLIPAAPTRFVTGYDVIELPESTVNVTDDLPSDHEDQNDRDKMARKTSTLTGRVTRKIASSVVEIGDSTVTRLNRLWQVPKTNATASEE